MHMQTLPLAQLMRYGQGHRPDVGRHGACARCLHGEQRCERCFYPFKQIDGHSGQTTEQCRSKGGMCGDGHLFELRPNPNKHPAQANLALSH